MRRGWSIVTAALAGVAIAACGGGSNAPSPTATPDPPRPITVAADEPLVIGVSAALSGDQSSIGHDIVDAVSLAVADFGGSVRGHAIKVVVSDDGCTDAEKARTIAREFVTDDALVGVIGPMCTTGAQAADRVYEAGGIIHISPSATRVDLSDQGERYFFRVSWRDDVQASLQATYAWNSLGAESVVLVDDAEPYGRGLADEFNDAYQRLGGRVVSRERIPRGTTDMSDLARKVKSASADAVVFEGLNPEGALAIKALRMEQYTGTFMGPDGLLNARDFLGAGGSATDGAIISGGPAPDDTFTARFQATTQRVPATPFVLQAHDAVTALLKAVNASVDAPSGAAPGAITLDRPVLSQKLREQDFTGLTGPIRFDERGDRVSDSATEAGIVIYRVTDGRFVPVP
jgi:branched-chain amino acid transport system substrate-binding protein